MGDGVTDAFTQREMMRAPDMTSPMTRYGGKDYQFTARKWALSHGPLRLRATGVMYPVE